MIHLLAHDLDQKMTQHSLEFHHFQRFAHWQEYFEGLLNIGYLQSVTTPKPTKFAIAGTLIHNICQATDLSEHDLLDIAQLPADYLAKVRLGMIRMSHGHLAAFAEGAMSFIEDRAEYQTACLLFFMSYRQAMLLDIEREMLREYGAPIDQILREMTGFLSSKREQKRVRRMRTQGQGLQPDQTGTRSGSSVSKIGVFDVSTSTNRGLGGNQDLEGVAD